MLRGLQVDNNYFPAFALGDEWKVSAGFDLHGGAQRQCQVGLSNTERAQRFQSENVSGDLTTTWWLRLDLREKKRWEGRGMDTHFAFMKLLERESSSGNEAWHKVELNK